MQSTRPRFGDHTPPAIFPTVLGLQGLALAWMRAAGTFNLPIEIGQLLLGVSVSILVFTSASYALKFMRRPGVFAEDIRVLPGRTGLTTMFLAYYAAAAGLTNAFPSWAPVFFGIGFLGHVALVAGILSFFEGAPPEQRQVNPAWHLHFVGFIVGAMAAVPMGLTTLATVIFFPTLFMAAVIWAVSFVQFLRASPPPPLRPMLAIHLAPASLLGIVAGLLGFVQIATFMGALGGVLLLAMILGARYLTKAGFSPLWGSFTFPVASFATLCMMLSATGPSWLFRPVAGVVLVAATLMIPYIAYRVFQAWAKGRLSAATNAARV